MPWQECNRMDERLKFIARVLCEFTAKRDLRWREDRIMTRMEQQNTLIIIPDGII